MAEWRFGTGWSHGELARGLERAAGLPRNFDTGAPLSSGRGWNLIHSRALIAREPPGPPLHDGAFETLWWALGRFHHSDPRIVVAHFRDDVPLGGRPVLLELQALGLRFLCPTTIGGVREETSGRATLRGFCLETLAGNIERGREWFLLDKDHASGEVRFRIEAAWRDGDFPTGWSRLGFRLVGRRYQRAWHRLAHLRLRRIAAGLDPGDAPGPDHLVHEGPPMPGEPVQFMAQRGVGRYAVDVEQEEEEMSGEGIGRAIGLGALSGLRSLGPAAMLVRRLEAKGGNVLAGRGSGRVLAVLAAGELLGDKLPFAPARTQAPSVLARTASGAFVASRAVRRARLRAALLGGIAAVATTYAGYRLRHLAARRSRALGLAVALAEDALVLWGGSRLVAAAPR